MHLNRQVHIQDQEWRYRVGASTIRIKSPSGKTFDIGVIDIKPYIDRGRWKKTPDGMVKPSDIREYIETHLLNDSAEK